MGNKHPGYGSCNCFNLVGVSLILQGRAWVRRPESTNHIGVGDWLVLFHRLGNFGHLEVSSGGDVFVEVTVLTYRELSSVDGRFDYVSDARIVIL